jgi:uncharacterized OB-fold protein
MKREWVDAPTDARVYSFTWIHTAGHPAVSDSLPYNVAVVEFPALPGVRLISNVVDVAPGELATGDTLILIWERVGESRVVPRFRKR